VIDLTLEKNHLEKTNLEKLVEEKGVRAQNVLPNQNVEI
jgi:hypothetical protein